ncbi:hypothetical protein BDF14DRAFT_1759436 [Spinellus fusiger]|nr:hypothetical protein BDF14DRAFT_1759436 [Spinellus fusiger]
MGKQLDDTFVIAEEFNDAPVEAIDTAKAERKKLRAAMTKEQREESRKVNRENRKKKKTLKEKNKKRKKGEQVSDSEEEDDNKDAEDKDTVKPKSKKSKAEKSEKRPDEHGIWVGNLAFSTSSEDIRKYFEDCGEITRIKCPKGDTPKKNNKGFAYVFFNTVEAVTKGVEKSEVKLDGRALLIKDAKNFERKDGTTTTAKEIKKQKNPPCPTLFLGNLSFETTSAMVKEHFEWCGSIRKVRLAEFQDTGKCKGFGYIDFMHVDYATKAIRAPDKHTLDGRKVRVEFAGQDAYLRGHPWLMREKKKEEEASKA